MRGNASYDQRAAVQRPGSRSAREELCSDGPLRTVVRKGALKHAPRHHITPSLGQFTCVSCHRPSMSSYLGVSVCSNHASRCRSVTFKLTSMHGAAVERRITPYRRSRARRGTHNISIKNITRACGGAFDRGQPLKHFEYYCPSLIDRRLRHAARIGAAQNARSVDFNFRRRLYWFAEQHAPRPRRPCSNEHMVFTSHVFPTNVTERRTVRVSRIKESLVYDRYR